MIRWTGEAEAGIPYWWEALGDAIEDDPLPDSCDVLVIGAGYAGLSAAIAAHECGAKVAVVDAGEPGKGASTRNGGMMGAHPRISWEATAARFGGKVADAVFAEAAPALDWVKGLISKEEIDCDLQMTGRVQLAWTRAQFAAQTRLAVHAREKGGARVAVLDRDRLGQEIETERYFGGLLFPDHCAVHPAKYHRGLLAAVRRRGIPVVGRAEVVALEKANNRFKARTRKGEVQVGKVILCTNGYTTPAFRWHLRRVFPLPSFIIATQELDPNRIGHLAPGRRMMVETRARHSYYRVSPDGTRIIFGGRASMRALPIAVAAARLHQTMCEIWPELQEVKLSHAWSGFTGFSFNHTPHVGEKDGVHYAMGFCGSGTVMAPYLGAKAAFRAMGDPRGETAYAETPFKTNPLHLFERPHFLKAADIWYRQWVDRIEARQGR